MLEIIVFWHHTSDSALHMVCMVCIQTDH